ncbi:hypothetical protein Tco_0960640, partial [Tanacetum coccineum]
CKQAYAQLIDDQLVPGNYRFEISSANKKVDPDNIPSHAPLAEIVKKVEAIENITLVKEFILAEVVKQMVVGDGEGEESDSYDAFLLNQEDLDIRLESRSHKESPEEMVNVTVNVVDDDNDDDQHNVDSLIKKKKTGSLELRDTEM